MPAWCFDKQLGIGGGFVQSSTVGDRNQLIIRPVQEQFRTRDPTDLVNGIVSMGCQPAGMAPPPQIWGLCRVPRGDGNCLDGPILRTIIDRVERTVRPSAVSRKVI